MAEQADLPALPPHLPPPSLPCRDLSQLGLRISQLPDLAPSRRDGWEGHAPLLASLAPAQLCFQKLEVLRLSDNAVGGSLPASWGDLPRLQTLDLSRNALQGAWVAWRRLGGSPARPSCRPGPPAAAVPLA